MGRKKRVSLHCDSVQSSILTLTSSTTNPLSFLAVLMVLISFFLPWLQASPSFGDEAGHIPVWLP